MLNAKLFQSPPIYCVSPCAVSGTPSTYKTGDARKNARPIICCNFRGDFAVRSGGMTYKRRLDANRKGVGFADFMTPLYSVPRRRVTGTRNFEFCGCENFLEPPVLPAETLVLDPPPLARTRLRARETS